MAQQLGALVAFAEDPGLVPSTHMVAYNHPNYSLKRHNLLTSEDTRYTHDILIFMQARHIHL